MEPLSRTAAATRRNLMDAFWRLYKEKGMQLTVKEVTALAGYHRGVFYQYFDSTQQLLEELEDSLLGYIQERAVSADISVEFSERMIGQIKQLYEEYGEYLCVLLGEKGDPAFSKRFKALVKSEIRTKLLLPEETPLRTELVLEYTLTAILSAFTQWYVRKDELPEEEFIRLIRSLILKGSVPALLAVI